MSLALTNFHDVVDINRNLLNAVDKIDKLYVGSYEKEQQALQEQFYHGDFKLPEDGDYSYLFAYWPDEAFNPLKKDYLKPTNMRGMFFGSSIKNLANQCTLDLSECTDATNAFARCYNLTKIHFPFNSITGGENFVLSFQDCPLESSEIISIIQCLKEKSKGGKGGTVYFKKIAGWSNQDQDKCRGCWKIRYVSVPETIVYPCASLESELDSLELANFENNDFLKDNKEIITSIYNNISLIPMKLRGDIVTKYPQIFNPTFTIDRGFNKNGQFYKTDFNQLTNAAWWSQLQWYNYADHGKSSNFQKEAPDRWYHRNLIMPFSNWKRWVDETDNDFDDQAWFGLSEDEYIYNYRDDDNVSHIGLEDKFFNPQGFLNQTWYIQNGYRLFENCGMTSITDRVNLNLAKCVSANRMFAECSNLKSIDQELDFTHYGKEIKQCKSVFLNCKNLESIQQITSLTSLKYASGDILSPFAGCTNLKEIRFKPYSGKSYYGIGSSINFGDCKNLSSESINSIIEALAPNTKKTLTLDKQVIDNYLDKSILSTGKMKGNAMFTTFSNLKRLKKIEFSIKAPGVLENNIILPCYLSYANNKTSSCISFYSLLKYNKLIDNETKNQVYVPLSSVQNKMFKGTIVFDLEEQKAEVQNIQIETDGGMKEYTLEPLDNQSDFQVLQEYPYVANNPLRTSLLSDVLKKWHEQIDNKLLDQDQQDKSIEFYSYALSYSTEFDIQLSYYQGGSGALKTKLDRQTNKTWTLTAKN